MNSATRLVAGGLALCAVALLTGGCEDDLDPVAAKDGSITMTANPQTIVLDVNDPEAPRDPVRGGLVGSATVLAQVFDKDGNRSEGVTVVFSTTGGRLGSAGPPGSPPTEVTTDTNGYARDTLTLTTTDELAGEGTNQAAGSARVTARSGLVTGTVDVTRSVVGCDNDPPAANGGPDITQIGGVLATTVVLDGRATTDDRTPFSQLSFLWNCGNGTAPQPASGLEDDFPIVVACDYEVGEYTAILTVFDTGNGLEDPDTGELLCVLSASDEVEIAIE